MLEIYGVDECEGDETQRITIHIFAKFLSTNDSLMIVLFSSRTENPMKTTSKQHFATHKSAFFLQQLSLDDHYLSAKDIRRFLDHKFPEVKVAHSMSHLLAPDRPAKPAVLEIANKLSGQFIYASVVMNFICFPRSYPAHQLDIIRDLRLLPVLATPFAHLDALYRYIFSQQ